MGKRVAAVAVLLGGVLVVLIGLGLPSVIAPSPDWRAGHNRAVAVAAGLRAASGLLRAPASGLLSAALSISLLIGRGRVRNVVRMVGRKR